MTKMHTCGKVTLNVSSPVSLFLAKTWKHEIEYDRGTYVGVRKKAKYKGRSRNSLSAISVQVLPAAPRGHVWQPLCTRLAAWPPTRQAQCYPKINLGFRWFARAFPSYKFQSWLLSDWKSNKPSFRMWAAVGIDSDVFRSLYHRQFLPNAQNF